MEMIKYIDIDFNSLEKLKSQGTKATLYKNDNECIKILDGLYDAEKKALYGKFLDMDGIKIENVLLPKKLIIKNDKLQGFTMDYFPNSTSLFDKYLIRYVNTNKLLNDVFKASKILRTIHDNNIICQDLSFDNILVDEDDKIVYCDIDGCSYINHISPFISVLLKNFLVDFRNEKIPVSFNLDRISMMISFYYLMYFKEVQNLTKRQYHKLSNKITTLENAEKYATRLIDRTNFIGDIPYLDELINLEDDFVFDREKQKSLKERFLRR